MKGDLLDRDITKALRRLSKFIHDNPELCFKEHRAHNACIAFLEQYCREGWKITSSAYDLETAWEAVYSQGVGGRRVVFCSEYDALPKVGHACISRLKTLINGRRSCVI
jgi:metal-dependent amidase/aminoacylase/carboxypeptidase family protein